MPVVVVLVAAATDMRGQKLEVVGGAQIVVGPDAAIDLVTEILRCCLMVQQELLAAPVVEPEEL